ncbi:hypothetical protein [Pandoraea bronchicola]|uniref:hypothetical protein n=1 Tax=Pandoraea bronchicola TaxID=2508287 RepID=UPI001240AC46|nr:hypothetical protein [Pandoraea bronchicola]
MPWIVPPALFVTESVKVPSVAVLAPPRDAVACALNQTGTCIDDNNTGVRLCIDTIAAAGAARIVGRADDTGVVDDAVDARANGVGFVRLDETAREVVQDVGAGGDRVEIDRLAALSGVIRRGQRAIVVEHDVAVRLVHLNDVGVERGHARADAVGYREGQAAGVVADGAAGARHVDCAVVHERGVARDGNTDGAACDREQAAALDRAGLPAGQGLPRVACQAVGDDKAGGEGVLFGKKRDDACQNGKWLHIPRCPLWNLFEGAEYSSS